MVGRTRSSRRLSAAWATATAIAVAVCAVAGCSGDTGATPHGSVADPHAYQDPPGNPQEALLNGEVPLGNPQQPPGNPQQPSINPEQPTSSGGPSAANITARCNAFCATFANTCFAACDDGCGGLGVLSPVCLATFSTFFDCILGGQVTCGRNGRLQIPNGGACFDEARAVISCLNGAATTKIEPPGPAGMPNDKRGP